MNVFYTFSDQSGIGDNIRGLISLLQIKELIKKEKELNIFVDFSESKIVKYLKHRLPDNILKLKHGVETHFFYIADKRAHCERISDYLLNSTTDVVSINTNGLPDETNITEEIKEFIHKILEFNEDFDRVFSEYLRKVPVDFNVYHYRFGDERFQSDTEDGLISAMCSEFDTIHNKPCLVISDSLLFKQKIYELYKNEIVFVFLNEPAHNRDDKNVKVLDDSVIFIDFFLITRAKFIYSYSSYDWVSNFCLWSSYIYNIPLYDLKNNKIINRADE